MAVPKIQQKRDEINVLVTPHALERIEERLQMQGMKRGEIIKELNDKLNKGYIREIKNQDGRYLLGFEGPNLYFILKKEGEAYLLLTVEWRLEHNYPTKKINIKYF